MTHWGFPNLYLQALPFPHPQTCIPNYLYDNSFPISNRNLKLNKSKPSSWFHTLQPCFWHPPPPIFSISINGLPVICLISIIKNLGILDCSLWYPIFNPTANSLGSTFRNYCKSKHFSSLPLFPSSFKLPCVSGQWQQSPDLSSCCCSPGPSQSQSIHNSQGLKKGSLSCSKPPFLT